MHGIWGRESEGACSIVLSGGYEDDIDDLNYILYTGQGGQDKPGGKQVADQKYVRGNKALVLSSKYDLPVRVTRGHQIPNGPDKGYRYDGLYYVNKFERIKGQSGYYICRFHLSSEKEIEKLETELKPTLKSDYKRTERASATVNRLKRNVKLSEEIKKMYDYKCQVCDIYLKTPYGGIAIGAHIKGLGKPHNGPDVIENMICLCPNHHEQFDDYGFYIDPETFEIVDSINVTLNGEKVEKLNELECDDEKIWANIWQTDQIVEINPTTGYVTHVLDASNLPVERDRLDSGAVLNGIARIPGSDNFLITGKLWPKIFEVNFNDN